MVAFPFSIEHLLDAGAILGMDRIEKGLQPLVNALARTAKNSFVGRIDVKDLADIFVGQPDYVFKVFRHLPESLFTFIERLFSVDSIQGFATVIRQGLKSIERR